MRRVTPPRVLLVVPQLPWPIRDGADLRLLSIAAALARSATVSVAALSGGTSPAPSFVHGWVSAGLASPDGPPIVRQLLEHPDDPFGPFASAAAVDFLRVAVRDARPDLVVLARLQVWRVAVEALDERDMPLVLDLDASNARVVPALDSIAGTDPAARILSRFNKAAARYELRVLPDAAAVWVSSAVEAEAVIATTGRESTVVVNAVDVDQYAAPHVERVAGRLLYPGSFRYPPNELAARELVEEIAPRLPGHDVLIVGSHAPSWLCAGSWPGVTVVGRVPSMVEYLASASAVVVPLRAGTGTRLKIIEAMAAGAPVISTAVGAEGLDLEPGRHYLAAETADDFVDAVLRLDEDAELARVLADAGRQIVRDRYSVDAIAPVLAGQVDQVLEAVAAR